MAMQHTRQAPGRDIHMHFTRLISPQSYNLGMMTRTFSERWEAEAR